MNRRIKKGFDEEGVEIPFPHRTYTIDKASNPVDLNIKEWESYSSEVKVFIRKIIKETLGQQK